MIVILDPQMLVVMLVLVVLVISSLVQFSKTNNAYDASSNNPSGILFTVGEAFTSVRHAQGYHGGEERMFLILD